MKTEIDRICGIMYTLLEHQPVIDVPYEKINDIAVALVKEGYGKVSEYETEREMLGSKIKVLKQRLNNKYVEIERLKANGYRSIMDAFENNRDKIVENIQTEIDDYKQSIKQAQIDVLNKLKERIKTAIDTYFNLDGGGYYLAEDAIDDIDELIEEVQNGKDKG